MPSTLIHNGIDFLVADRSGAKGYVNCVKFS